MLQRGVTEAHWRWDQQISPTVVIKKACGGLKPRLTSDARAKASVHVRGEEGERERENRGGPQTIENNTQRAFNDSILMLCKWLNLSEGTQQRQCCGENCIDSKHII